MIDFEYHNPTSLEQVFELLDQHGEDARVMAGGTALVSASHRRPRMGQLDFATWYKGRLYLFATKANLAEFQQQPDRFDR